MTNSALRFATLITIVLLLFPPPASAGWDDVWDYLDALSGPGPFDARGNVTVSGICPATMAPEKSEAKIARFLGRGTVNKRKIPCAFIDFRRFVADPKLPYSRVDASLIDIGLTWQVVHPIEVGFAATRFHFKTTSVPPINEWDLTPIRLVVRPLALFPVWRDKKAAGTLKWFIQATFRHKHLTGQSFGVPDSVFHSNFDVLTSSGFIIDLGQLIGN
jgi:hypothetical protein